MRKLFLGLVLMLVPALAVQEVQAQVEIGPSVVLAEDVDFGVGAIVVFSLESVHESLEGSASFDFYFPDLIDYFQIDGVVRYLIPISNESILPFVAGGLGIGRFSFDADGILGDDFSASTTEVGLLVGGGLKFEAESVNPFVQLLLGIGDIPSFGLKGGITFPVGGS